MIDDWCSDNPGEMVTRRLHESPWIHVSQFWYPRFDVFAGRIVTFGLAPRILHAEIGRGISSSSRTPLPTAVVRRDVAIDQFLHKILLSFSPVEVEILGQEHRDNHSDPIVHETSRIQLPHPGVNDWKPGTTVAPPLKDRVIFVPLQREKPVAKIAFHNTWKMGKDLHIKFAPNYFVQVRIDALACGGRRLLSGLVQPQKTCRGDIVPNRRS